MSLQLPARSLNVTLPARDVTTFTYNSLEMSFDGGDYLILPDIITDFTLSLQAYIPSYPEGNVYLFYLGIQADSPTNYITLEITSLGEMRFFQGGVEIASGEFEYSTYYDMHVYMINSRLGINIPGVMVAEVVFGQDQAAWDLFLLGATYYLGNFRGYIPNGSKIKNVSGIIRFGTAYTDTAQTTEAGVNDKIASIVNKGIAGGNIIQSTTAARPTLVSVPSISLEYIKLTLPTRDGIGTYVAPSSGDGAVFDEDVFDGSVFG